MDDDGGEQAMGPPSPLSGLAIRAHSNTPATRKGLSARRPGPKTPDSYGSRRKAAGMQFPQMRNHPAFAGGRNAASGANAETHSAADLTEWARERADCCTAGAAVQVVLPRQAPESAALLLCAHHFRGSRRTLGALAATVFDTYGFPVGTDDLLFVADDR